MRIIINNTSMVPIYAVSYTHLMTREYDLDGYVIIFTSNLPNETEYKKVIPPELQTRFDLVCELSLIHIQMCIRDRDIFMYL